MHLDPKVRRVVYRCLYPEKIAEWDAMKSEPHPNGLRFEPILDKKVLFIHIPKCAGTSVCEAIFGGPTGSHLPLWKYEIAFSPKEMASLWRFTFFRNPYDRIFSAYRFLKRGGLIEADGKFRDTYIGDADFNEFVRTALVNPRVRENIVFRDQVEFIRSRGSRKPLHFAGFCETFREDFAKVLRRLGLDEALAATRTNASGKQPVDYRDGYSGESIDIVRRIYREDIETLGYEFDTPFCPTQRKKVADALCECPASSWSGSA